MLLNRIDMKTRVGKYCCKIKKSSAGLGLFAMEDIPKDKFIIEYFGKILSVDAADKKGGRYLFEINSKKVIDGTPRRNIARYINHSCRPNCETNIVKGKIYIYSRRKIKEGEELNYDYGREYFNDQIKPFGCRCLKCLK